MLLNSFISALAIVCSIAPLIYMVVSGERRMRRAREVLARRRSETRSELARQHAEEMAELNASVARFQERLRADRHTRQRTQQRVRQPTPPTVWEHLEE